MIDALVGSEYFVLLMFPGVLLAIFLGFPVSFSLMGMSLIFGYFGFGDAVGAMLVRRVWDIANNYVLAAVPLFVFMGSMLEASGIASRLFEAMIQWTGRLRGGMAIGTVIMCTIFAAATGIIGASEVVIGLLAIPPMLARKYNKGLICGTICAGGSLGTIIPPQCRDCRIRSGSRIVGRQAPDGRRFPRIGSLRALHQLHPHSMHHPSQGRSWTSARRDRNADKSQTKAYGDIPFTAAFLDICRHGNDSFGLGRSDGGRRPGCLWSGDSNHHIRPHEHENV